jgi:hypothetical protein
MHASRDFSKKFLPVDDNCLREKKLSAVFAIQKTLVNGTLSFSMALCSIALLANGPKWTPLFSFYPWPHIMGDQLRQAVRVTL